MKIWQKYGNKSDKKLLQDISLQNKWFYIKAKSFKTDVILFIGTCNVTMCSTSH